MAARRLPLSAVEKMTAQWGSEGSEVELRGGGGSWDDGGRSGMLDLG
jgi:hypothetical protein